MALSDREQMREIRDDDDHCRDAGFDSRDGGRTFGAAII